MTPTVFTGVIFVSRDYILQQRTVRAWIQLTRDRDITRPLAWYSHELGVLCPFMMVPQALSLTGVIRHSAYGRACMFL